MGPIRVLTWNLFHGRSLPPAGRPLLTEFAELLRGWDWEIALLQEVPPWWAPALARAADAEFRRVLTSRNLLLGARRMVAERWPDAIKSNGGGSNVVLVRGLIVEHRSLRLRMLPERRVAQLVGTEDVCIANFHASERVALAQDELRRLIDTATGWAADRPLILGGDLNLREPAVPMTLAARGTVDFVFARGLCALGSGELLDAVVQTGAGPLRLSDHQPVLATLRLPAARSGVYSGR